MEKVIAITKHVVDYNPIQPIWDLRIGYEHIFASPLFPVIISVGFYFTLMLPCTIMDIYGKNWKWLQKYKIQTNKEVTWPLVFNAMIRTGWNHILYILPLSLSQWIWTPDTDLEATAPTPFQMLWQLCAMFVIFDFQYFVWHRCHHKNRWLYRHFHAIHHQYHSTFCWTTQYLHPWELITVGFFTTVNPWIFHCHCLTAWIWMLLNVIVSVEAHLGYDFPLAPGNLIPFDLWGGATKHDMHHLRPLSNYQPYLNTWDKLMGEWCPGIRGGGFKPDNLIAYEEKQKQLREENRRKREAARLALREEDIDPDDEMAAARVN